MKMQTSKVSTLRHRATVRIKKDIVAWALILPSVILFTVFFWQPIVSSIYLSFFKTAGFEAVNFVGFNNYIILKFTRMVSSITMYHTIRLILRCMR